MNENKWKWQQLTSHDIEEMKKEGNSESSHLTINIIEEFQENTANSLRIEFPEDDSYYIMKGSLVYDQNLEDEKDYKIFHFYLSNETLITVDFDLTIFKHCDTNSITNHMKIIDKPIEGFSLIVRELLTEYLVSIDDFEDKLRNLVWGIHQKNNTDTLDKVFKRRQELLVWKNLLIPLREIIFAIEELCLDEISNNKIYNHTEIRLKRALYLINEYEHEVDSIINLEEVISSHRGNEIMKTLTVMTAIFTPVTAWGALWGMNFKHMPELEWTYGYLFSLTLIILSMVAVYIYLKMKGWTGDLLRGKKKGSFFK